MSKKLTKLEEELKKIKQKLSKEKRHQRRIKSRRNISSFNMTLNRLGSDLASSDDSSYILAALAVKLAEMPEGELKTLINLGKEHVYEDNGRVYCVKEPDSSEKNS